ncbi:MAG: endopeptidase La, partial [Rhizobiaceae bacterium]|nr:endopeptidase La [Rhizobiaceae bacterium]
MTTTGPSKIELSSGETFPLLPLRDIVVFPHMIVPLFVGREKSIAALEEVMNTDRQILLFTQKNASDDDPAPESLYEIGSIASVLQLLKLPDGTVKVLVEGVARARVSQFTERDDYFEAYAEIIEDEEGDPIEMEALSRSVVSEFEGYVKLNKKVSPEVLTAVTQIEDYTKLADTVASHLAVKISEKQEILGIFSVKERLEHVLGMMESEISVLQVEKRIRSRVKRQMEKTQREYYLNEQMKAIQKELGEGEDGRDELGELEERIKKTKLSKEAREKADNEFKKLKQMSPMSAEATVVRNYLDWLLGIPWGKRSPVKTDLNASEEVLDADHYGLEKVKERIIEYLAVQSRAKKIKGPILCLVGPPGVGKTSLGKSIARATGREFVRMALGGVRDEAEIRGHRRTYIGSMPGKVIQSMKKAKKTNPLFLLDEIDKMGQDFRGDPSAALLEVLDPEQNSTFSDHYLEVEYDLSNVMFITTANTLNIPGPLMDRMEIIRIAGYTEDEKLEIAKRHLLSKTMKDHALVDKEFSITDDAIRTIIQTYTREAGVRSLERELAKLARKAVTEIMKTKKKSIKITNKNIEDYLGVPKFRFGQAEDEDQVGVVTGLAWTEVGGELLTIESVSMPGKGKMTVTGNLRDVMKESVSAAASYVRSRAVDFGIEPPKFDKNDIHVHVPEGATPKDGPSAGVAMAVSIVSVMTGIPIHKSIAMTGEITLRGRVLPIGGLKEKLLAALRGGITKVLIPEENAKDLADIPDNVKNALEIVP